MGCTRPVWRYSSTAAAARCPLATASMAAPGPVTTSPQAKTPGAEVLIVGVSKLRRPGRSAST